MADAAKIYDAWVSLQQAAIMVERAVDARLKEWNLSGSQAVALSVLLTHGPQRMSDLARYLLQQTQTTTDLVDRLENRGLVQRARDATDRRVVKVEATPTAEKLVAEIGGADWAVCIDAFGALSQTKLNGLIDAARAVRDRAAKIANVSPEHLDYAQTKLRLNPEVSTPMAAD